MENIKILVIGDSCEDIFIYGKCRRICPEAPVPIFIPLYEKKNGGMSLNVYGNIKSLNYDVDIITHKENITKTRFVDETSNQILLRVDNESNKVEKIKDINHIDFKKYSAVVISDYDKGFLDSEDIKFICEKNQNTFIDTKKIIDHNFKDAKFIKINEEEYLNNLKKSNYIKKLKKKLIVTLGDKGCKLNNKVYSTDPVIIRDIVGAGDTFISSMVLKYLQTQDIEKSIRFANMCATLIVQQKGVNQIGEFKDEVEKWNF
jgi:D-beta-D-heptose 7-phosphate kinase/D-beta-D-heptose 1-phosphate adenosyltransferase